MKFAPNPKTAKVVRLCEHENCMSRIYLTNRSGLCLFHYRQVRHNASKARCGQCGAIRDNRTRSGNCMACTHPVENWEPPVHVRIIVRTVADALRISERDIIGKRRFSRLVAGRSFVAKILTERGLSQTQSARMMSLNDHTTVGNLLKRFDHFAAVFPHSMGPIDKFRGLSVLEIIALGSPKGWIAA